MAKPSLWNLSLHSFIFNIHLDMHDEAAQIRDFMQRNGLNQGSLAAAAGVSQPTVSRALVGGPQRRGRAFLRLLAHVGTARVNNPPSATAKKRVARAFEKIWDGSDVHAAVVARIIEDLAGLTPSPALRRRLEQRKRA
ncbi:MAG: helix-turn-helix transcriptional regulator [Candidatus Korobacteraceae bacterium]